MKGLVGVNSGIFRKIRFAGMEVDFSRQELRRRGLRLRLQHKPFQILELLLRRPGTLVTREELARHLWPDSHVSVERGLNTAVNALRQVLGDTAPVYRFIETRPGLGYCFIAPVQEIVEAETRSQSLHPDCLKGHFFLDKMTGQDTRKAMAHFEAVLSNQGCSVYAHAGLTDAWCQTAQLAVSSPPGACAKAKEFAILALSSDSQAASAHAALGRARMLCDWDWKRARAGFLRALDLDLQSVASHRYYAALLSVLNDHAGALDQIQTAQSLEPLSLPIGVEHASFLLAQGNDEAAADQYWKVLALEAQFWPAQLGLGFAYYRQGARAEALAELTNAVTCSGGNPLALSLLGYLFKDKAASILEQLQQTAALNYVNPFSYALLHYALGQHSETLHWLARAEAEHDPAMLWGPQSNLKANLQTL